MRFMVIVKATKHSEAGQMPSMELIQAMGKYNEELVKAGVMLAGDGLAPSKQAVRLQWSDQGAAPVVTDGPFAETKELVSGYWIIQAKSLAEATEWIRRAPFDRMPIETNVEIRRIMEPADYAEVMSPAEQEREAKLAAELAARKA